MQNIPAKAKDIRKMFCATEGYVLIGSDYSGQEPRLLAHMSGDSDMIQAFKDGFDLYSWVASTIYNLPYEECREFRPDGTVNPEGKKRRGNSKSVLLGLLYGRGATSIGEQIGESKQEAQKIIDMVFKRFPKVKEFVHGSVQHAKDYGFVETNWGRKRRLPDIQLPEYQFEATSDYVNPEFDILNFDDFDAQTIPQQTINYYWSKLQKAWGYRDKQKIKDEALSEGIRIIDNGGKIADAERQCVNSRIQGSAADMTKIAMIAVHNDPLLKELGFRLLISVHDELIGEAPIENAKEAGARFVELMVECVQAEISVPFKCDAEYSYEWYGDSIEV